MKKDLQQIGIKYKTGEILQKIVMSGEELYWKPKSIIACRAEEEEVNNPLNH